MSLVIVYSFAVDPSLLPVVGAPSYGVLARQIPRLVVGSLNGEGDRGLRFFPLLGPRDGRRQFFMIPDMLPPEQLVKIHGQQQDVKIVVDGRIDATGVHVRIVDPATLREVFEETLPLDPLDPFAVVTRMVYELSGLLDWTGPLPKLPALAPPDLSYFLVAKDDLLSLEAGFEREGEGHWVQAIAEVAQNHLDKIEVRELLLEICRRLSVAEAGRAEVVAVMKSAVARTDDTEFLGGAAVVLHVFDEAELSAEILERLIGRELVDESAVLRVVGYLFQRGRHLEGRRQLEIAIQHGPRSPRLLAQLMVMHQRLGQTEERRAIAEELSAFRELPVPVGKMLCGELIEFEMIEEAIGVVSRCLEQEPENAGLWLELGRACMHSGDSTRAGAAFDTALTHDPSVTIRDEVARLRRFVDRPGVLPELEGLDEALAAGDLERALGLAQRLTNQHSDLGEGWLFLGIVHQRLDHTDLAIAGFRQALELDSELGEAHNRLGILLVGLGEYQQGYDHLRVAVARMAQESGPWIHFAQACFYLEHAEEGWSALDQAARLGASVELVESVRRAFLAENS